MSCSAHQCNRLSRRGSIRACSGWAASGARSRSSGRQPVSTPPPWATRAGPRPTRPTRRSAAGRRAIPRSCWSRSTPPQSASTSCSGCSGRGTIPHRGCARATTSAPNTGRSCSAPRSPSCAPHKRPAMPTSGCSAPAATARSRLKSFPRSSAHVLLRRGLPPAVPRQESERLLRPGRHGRGVPNRARHELSGLPPPRRARFENRRPRARSPARAVSRRSRR